jgi:hypothetical protein
MAETTKAAVKKKKVKKIKKVDPARQELDRLASDFITQVASDQIDSRCPSPARQFVRGVIDDKYALQTFKENLREQETPHDTMAKIYRYMGDEIIAQLKDEASSRRATMQRNLAEAQMEARKQAKADASKKKPRTSKKKPDDTAAADTVVVEKLSMEEIGKEMEERAEADAEDRKKREEEDAVRHEEQTRFDSAYQLAFTMYADTVRLLAGTDDNLENLVKQVERLGSSVLTDRQLAIDQILHEDNPTPALPALLSGVKDHVIAQKSVMTLGKVADPRLVSVLLGLGKEYATSKEANIRGAAFQSLGSVVQALDAKKKGSGTMRMFKLIGRESYEKELIALINLVMRDVNNPQMRKYYFSARCMKWMHQLGTRLMAEKQKALNVPLMKVKVHTPLSKSIREALKALEAHTGNGE